MDALLPDQLKAAWQAVESGTLDAQQWAAQEQRGLAAYRERWRSALLVDGQSELAASLLHELSAFTGVAREEVERRCRAAVETLARQWQGEVDARNHESIERFYGSEAYAYDLMWWHALEYDLSP